MMVKKHVIKKMINKKVEGNSYVESVYSETGMWENPNIYISNANIPKEGYGNTFSFDNTVTKEGFVTSKLESKRIDINSSVVKDTPSDGATYEIEGYGVQLTVCFYRVMPYPQNVIPPPVICIVTKDGETILYDNPDSPNRTTLTLISTANQRAVYTVVFTDLSEKESRYVVYIPPYVSPATPYQYTVSSLGRVTHNENISYSLTVVEGES